MGYDGPAVFRAPYGNDAALENFERTVLQGVPTDRVRRHASGAPTEGGVTRLWGTKESNDGTWQKLSAGDYLIFYRSDRYSHAAAVLGTEENDALAREIWPNFEEEPWDRIIYLEEPTEIDVPSEEIHDLAGYDIAYTMGFSPLNEMGIGGIRGRYGSVEAFAAGEAPGAVETPVPREPGERPEDTAPTDPPDLRAEPTVELDDALLDGLYFPPEVERELLESIESALAAGKHLVFTGPPGTGKTVLAQRLCRRLVESNPGIYTGSQLTTATADWSTFETVGGYMPSERGDGEELTFEPGIVLRRFKREGTQANELLVIDEINRADIDKAFGQLFTLLSGQPVRLPYRRDGAEIVLRSPTGATDEPAAHEFVKPDSWRLFATMNTYDKTSLYELSYAFMRRFAFVHVAAPTIPEEPEERRRMLGRYADRWGLDPDRETADAVAAVWGLLNRPGADRRIGPALVEDLLRSVEARPGRDRTAAITSAVGSYVLPQLEGDPESSRTVRLLGELEYVDGPRLADLAEDFLGVPIDGPR